MFQMFMKSNTHGHFIIYLTNYWCLHEILINWLANRLRQKIEIRKLTNIPFYKSSSIKSFLDPQPSLEKFDKAAGYSSNEKKSDFLGDKSQLHILILNLLDVFLTFSFHLAQKISWTVLKINIFHSSTSSLLYYIIMENQTVSKKRSLELWNILCTGRFTELTTIRTLMLYCSANEFCRSIVAVLVLSTSRLPKPIGLWNRL